MRILLLLLCMCCMCLASIPDSGTLLYRDSTNYPGKYYLALFGDSLPGGGGSQGLGTTAFTNTIWGTNGGGFTITNCAVGGTRWTQAMDQLTGLVQTVSPPPRFAFIDMGRNDILVCFPSAQVVPCEWPLISTQMYNFAATCALYNIQMMVGEVLPAYTNGDPAFTPCGEWALAPGGIFDLNYAYYKWCQTNQYSNFTHLVYEHDAFGVFTPCTTNIGWMNPLYNDPDGLHLRLGGFTNWAPIIVNWLSNFFPSPPSRVFSNGKFTKAGTY